VYLWSLSKKQGKTVNLLLITNENGSHYACIKHLSRLLSSQVNSHVNSEYFCLNYLQEFWSKDSLKKHQEWSLSNDGVAMIFPKPEDKIKFNSNHYCRKMRVPLAMYADFECFTKPVDCCEPNPQQSYT